MGIVTVQGRDELGRLLDVQLTTGADVAPPGPEVVTGGGAGGVTVDNQVDDPAEVTTLNAPGAVISGDEATLPSATHRIRLLEAVIDATDVTAFTNQNWVSDQEFAVVEGTWILDAWVQIPAGVSWDIDGVPTYALVAWATDVALPDFSILPVSGFSLLVGFDEDATAHGFERSTTRTVATQSYDSHLGSQQGLDDGQTMYVRELPARVAEACNLVPVVVSDGTAGLDGTVRLYALIAEPAA